MLISGFSDTAGRRPASAEVITLRLPLWEAYWILRYLLISQYLDWHWIFWFLLIFAGVFLVLLLLFLPETCRKAVGDESVPPPILNASVTYRRRKQNGVVVDPEKISEVRKNYALRFPSPIPKLRVVLDLETSVILVTAGLMFACFYAVMTRATTSFYNIYHLNDI